MILVPAFIYVLKKDPKTARATSICCILPMVITSSIFYYQNNYINWNIGVQCAIGGIIGGIIGSKLLNRMNDKILKVIFTILLVYSSIKMII